MSLDAGPYHRELIGRVAELNGLLDSVVAMHHADALFGPLVCVECGREWPCRTYMVIVGTPRGPETDAAGRT